MTCDSRIGHKCSTGDIVLIGMSRRHAEHWVSAGVIMGHNIVYSIKTIDGYQAVKQDLVDFLEHQAKPAGLFRFIDDVVLIKAPEIINTINNVTMVYPKWWERLLLKRQTKFKKENYVNITKVVMDVLNLDDLLDMNSLSDLERLL